MHYARQIGDLSGIVRRRATTPAQTHAGVAWLDKADLKIAVRSGLAKKGAGRRFSAAGTPQPCHFDDIGLIKPPLP